MTEEAAGTKPKMIYVALAAVFVLAGVAAGQLLVDQDVSTTLAEGVSVFAVLYVIAQGVERLVEFVISTVTLIDNKIAKTEVRFAESKKRAALAQINSTANGNPKPAEVTGDVETNAEKAKQARLDIAVFAQGLAFALSYGLVSYFEFGIFSVIGVIGIEPGVDRAITAIAVMGGAKGLHDLLGKIQKSKEAEETTGTSTSSHRGVAGPTT